MVEFTILKIQFSDVFETCQQEIRIVAQVWDGRALKLTFRRRVKPKFLDRWHELLNVLSSFIPNDMVDKPVWTLEAFGIYSTCSFYNMINYGGVSTPIWE